MVSQGVAAVDRALTILRAFEGEGDPEPLTLAALARRTGLYKSTMLRLMVSLQAFGYIVQLPDGRYHLGPTPFRLGSVYQRGNRLYDHVMPVLRALVAQGTESPSFHVRHDAKLRLCVAAHRLAALDAGSRLRRRAAAARSGRRGHDHPGLRRRVSAARSSIARARHARRSPMASAIRIARASPARCSAPTTSWSARCRCRGRNRASPTTMSARCRRR